MKHSKLPQVFLLVALVTTLICTLHAEPQRIKYKEVIRDSENNIAFVQQHSSASNDNQHKVLIAVIIRNNAYSLPTFLHTLENIRCPTNNSKCDLWVIFDKCIDESYFMFTYWLSNTRPMFDSIIMINRENDQKTQEKHPELDPLYFSGILKLRAIKYAVDRNFTHIFFINPDNIILNTDTIGILISKQKTIVAPMLKSTETKHSTFWMKSEDEINYRKNYLPIYNKEKIGCFKTIGVQKTFLIDLKDQSVYELLALADSNDLNDTEESDDDLWISINARFLNIIMHVCNREDFGYLPDLVNESIQSEREDSFIHLRIEHLLNGPNHTYNEPLEVTTYLEPKKATKTKARMGFDQIYVINLERRPDRLKRINSTLTDLNLSFTTFKAIDGKSIDEDFIRKLNISPLPGYKDPFSQRPINYGEIGCFLSHYFIWKEMLTKNYKKIIIFEDDARFSLNFRSNFANLMNQISTKQLNWELLYIGRKIIKDHAHEESWVSDIQPKNNYGLIEPSYSHWTLAYALTIEGAKKLIDENPLVKIIPVDEYLPVMYNKQPNVYWSSFFKKRDLKTYAIQPSLVYPTHYTGQPNHISDTEETKILKEKKDDKFDVNSNYHHIDL